MPETLKKILAVVCCIFVLATAFAGCSSSADNSGDTTKQITTDKAKIKDADAIALIKTYSADELGLDGSVDDYKIMVGSSGEKIDNDYYVKVIAAKISEPDANGSVNIEQYGQYYISYDGKTILSYNSDTSEYVPMKEVHEIPQTTLSEHND